MFSSIFGHLFSTITQQSLLAQQLLLTLLQQCKVYDTDVLTTYSITTVQGV